MKILHINKQQEGGASWCAMRISKALASQGLESRMLFAEGATMPDGIEGAIAVKDKFSPSLSWLTTKVRSRYFRELWHYTVKNYQKKLRTAGKEQLYLHRPVSKYSNIAHHSLVEWADIIHLHWVPEFVDYPSFFKNVGKPIVWTLHDKFPAVGIQHYCSEFSPVPKELTWIDLHCRKIKRNGILKARDLHVVAISEYMQTLCKESDVLHGFPCTLIHNGVDTEIFRPLSMNRLEVLAKYIDKVQTKDVDISNLITPDTKVFMFSSFLIWDRNKGLQRILDALEKIPCQNKALIVVGGKINDKESQPTASFPVFCTGLIKDQQELASLYSVADYFISASLEETFAQTPLEAMACGTPVISTPCSGATDLIQPFNGVVCDGYDAVALAEGISKTLMSTYNPESIRKYIIDNYEYSKIATEYIELYKHILKE